MNKIKHLLLQTLVVGLVSFFLHLIWEYLQCGTFFVMDDLTGHTRLMLSATLGDMNMSVVLLWILIWSHKDVYWLLKPIRRVDFLVILFYGLFLSFYFETHALFTGRWGYNPQTMPLVPGTPIALIPVVQLLILFPVAFFISRQILKFVMPNKENSNR